MSCGEKEAGGVYRPRQPRQTPFYQLVERFYAGFEAVYEERYQQRYGFWRPIIGTVVGKFLECGDLKHGFARVRCPKCREEFFVPLSCRVRCFCPSCHEKRSWKHSGFSVDQSVRLEAGDQEGIRRLVQYFLRCPFSQARMIEVAEAGKVIYKSEHNAVGRFPEPRDEELLAGPSRNFQVFDPLDFLAEVTQHIPNRGEHLIRHYGWYSNKTRGQRTQRQLSAGAGIGIAPHSPSAREARKGWAALIKQVYEAEPLCCPRCGAAMRIISFIESRQTEVIEKILRHCGLWEDASPRGPPVSPGSDEL